MPLALAGERSGVCTLHGPSLFFILSPFTAAPCRFSSPLSAAPWFQQPRNPSTNPGLCRWGRGDCSVQPPLHIGAGLGNGACVSPKLEVGADVTALPSPHCRVVTRVILPRIPTIQPSTATSVTLAHTLYRRLGLSLQQPSLTVRYQH